MLYMSPFVSQGPHQPSAPLLLMFQLPSLLSSTDVVELPGDDGHVSPSPTPVKYWGISP